MPLQTPDWDFDKTQLVAALRNFVALSDPRAQVLLTASAGSRFKLQMFTLGLSDLLLGRGLDAASRAGWRYLAQADDVTVAAELTQSSTRITSLTYGSHARQAINALTTLQQNDQLQANTYAVVHLRIPGVRVEAYWLRPVAQGGDRPVSDQVVPFSTPLNPVLKKAQMPTLFAPIDFFAAIKPVAERDLIFYGGDLAPRAERLARAKKP